MKHKHYAVTDGGGHAAGDRRMIEALLTIPGWRRATHEEYLKAKRIARKRDAVDAPPQEADDA